MVNLQVNILYLCKQIIETVFGCECGFGVAEAIKMKPAWYFMLFAFVFEVENGEPEAEKVSLEGPSVCSYGLVPRAQNFQGRVKECVFVCVFHFTFPALQLQGCQPRFYEHILILHDFFFFPQPAVHRESPFRGVFIAAGSF